MTPIRTVIINTLARAANAVADADYRRAERILRGLFVLLHGTAGTAPAPR